MIELLRLAVARLLIVVVKTVAPVAVSGVSRRDDGMFMGHFVAVGETETAALATVIVAGRRVDRATSGIDADEDEDDEL